MSDEPEAVRRAAQQLLAANRGRRTAIVEESKFKKQCIKCGHQTEGDDEIVVCGKCKNEYMRKEDGRLSSHVMEELRKQFIQHLLDHTKLRRADTGYLILNDLINFSVSTSTTINGVKMQIYSNDVNASWNFDVKDPDIFNKAIKTINPYLEALVKEIQDIENTVVETYNKFNKSKLRNQFKYQVMAAFGEDRCTPWPSIRKRIKAEPEKQLTLREALDPEYPSVEQQMDDLHG